MTSATPAALLEVALAAARAGGDAAMRWFRRNPPTELKRDGTFVTAADREAELAIRATIGAAFPDHEILGEEHGSKPGTGVRWIVDPIDGTESFVRGVPLWGVLVAAEQDGRIVAGVCHCPAAGETVHAARGLGARWNGAPCRVSGTSRLADALLAVTSPTWARARTPGWDRLESSVAKVRGWSDCYGYLLVVTGRAEIVVDAKMAVWDCGPFPVLFEEAGGRFTDWRGAARIDGGDAVATNGLLHDEVLALLATAASRPQ